MGQLGYYLSKLDDRDGKIINGITAIVYRYLKKRGRV